MPSRAEAGEGGRDRDGRGAAAPDRSFRLEGVALAPPLPPGARDSVLRAVGAGGRAAAYAADVGGAARELRGRPVPALPFGDWRLFDETGDRGRFEAAYFGRRRALVAAALAAWLYREPGDLALLEDCLWAICDEYAWALPAHLEGTCLESARLFPETAPEPGSAHRELLDLFACETAFALAEITTILEGSLTPIVAARARAEVERRVLLPFLAKRGPWRWELMRNNWCAVCAGSVGSAALHLVGDRERLERILARVLPTLDRFLESFSDDGACLEGVGYWTYGFGFFAAFADLLSRSTRGAIELAAGPRIERIAEFQGRCYLNGSLAVSFADGSAGERYRAGLAAWLAARFPGATPPPEGLAAPFGHDHYGRWCLSFRDLWWTAEYGAQRADPTPDIVGAAAVGPGSAAGAPGAATPAWLPDAQWLICPERAPGRLAFAAKGGHNDEPHNHNDIGSFELVLGERQLLADLGCGEYTRAYFSEGRYDILCNSSLGHSVPIIAGAPQSAGADRRARDARCLIQGEASRLELDIAGAYAVGGLARLRRAFEFDGRSLLVLRDEYEFEVAGFEVVERFVSRAPPESISAGEDGSALIGAGEGRALRVRCSVPGSLPSLASVESREHDGSSSRISLVDWRFRPAGPRFAVEFEFRLE